MTDAIAFKPVRGKEKDILAMEYHDGWVYFTTDTKKIYMDVNGQQKLSMGGNSGIYYGIMTYTGEIDTNKKDFDFTVYDIEGNLGTENLIIPNVNDLILNSDGCFYRVIGIVGEGINTIIKTTKLTIAGTGGTVGGIGAVISIVDFDGNATKYFSRDTDEALIKFTVTQLRGPEDNYIQSITYKIGSIDVITDYEGDEFGTDFEFDLLPYIKRMSTQEEGNLITISVTDIYGTTKPFFYTIHVIDLSLTSSIKDSILMTSTGSYTYYCTPKGGSALTNRRIEFMIYDANGLKIDTLEKDVTTSNSEIKYTLTFDKIGVYSIEVVYKGNIENTDTFIPSNILKYSVVNYSEDPLLVAYITNKRIEQYSYLEVNYMVATSRQTDDLVEVTLEKNGDSEEDNDIRKTEIPFNTLSTWSIYFDKAGWYNLSLTDEYNNIIEYEGIEVYAYEGKIPVIDPEDTDLYLSAINRSNDEKDKDSWTFKETTTTFNNFIWGNTNGWLKDNDGVDILRLSSGANIKINYPLFANDVLTESGGLTIELDFKVSGVTNFSQQLISCLGYTNATKETIQVGFQITGQESTMNTALIKATGGVIREGDDEETQAYNTSIQGLTAKFIENERIHLTWVVERNDNDYPMIKTYLNGIISGITKYSTNDQMVENPSLPAEFIVDSTYGVIDLYNIRVYKNPLDSQSVLNNYIATYGTAAQKAEKYMDNTGLLREGIINLDEIEAGSYQLSVPYIKITGGRKLNKNGDTGEYTFNTEDNSQHLPFTKKDYRLIDDLVFVDQSGTYPRREYHSVEKEDGTINGVIMYGQGTSSMEYPVKNLRLKWKMRDADGNKVKFTVNNDDCPVDLICLKADYMESSGSHNTGAANLIYDLLKEINQKTPAQEYYTKDKVGYSVVTTIRGYPILVFYKPAGDEDAKFEFVGKYNLNLDKATQEPFGFFPDPEEKPSVITGSEFGWIADSEGNIKESIHCYEFLNNASALANFLSESGKTFEETFFGEKFDSAGVSQGPGWFSSYESRYPEQDSDLKGSDVDIASFYRLCSWINSTSREEATNLSLSQPIIYNDIEYTIDSSEYRLAKFKAECENYLNKDFMLFYYVLTHLLLMIDSRAKNMMIATWDDQIWYPIFYDMDTMLGLNNYGYNKFSYDVEDTAENVYNGQASVLWNNVRDAFQAEIRDKYNELQSKSNMNYSTLLSAFGTHQADAVNEAVYNADSLYKYIRPFNEGYMDGISGDPVWVNPGAKDYLYASPGSRSMHRRWWINNRLQYFNGMYLSEDYKSDKYILRLYTPVAGEDNYTAVLNPKEEEFSQYYIRIEIENGEFIFTLASEVEEEFSENTSYFIKAPNALGDSVAAIPPDNSFILTPLYNQYLSVAYGGDNGTTIGPIKALANTETKITTTDKFNDTETYIYGASQLKSLGDLSKQYLGALKFPGRETKLETLILGNENNKYYNFNFSSLAIGTDAPYLKTLNIMNCSGLGGQTLDLKYCNNLQQIYATGSNLTSVDFAEHGILEEVRLPNTISSLILVDQPNLTTEKFTVGTYNSDTKTYSNNSYNKLTDLRIDNVPNLNTYNIILDLIDINDETFQRYSLKEVVWEASPDTLDYDNGLSQVLDYLKTKQPHKDVGEGQPLTGTLSIPSNGIAANKLIQFYNNYWPIYPELDIIFDEDSNIYSVDILNYDDTVQWSKKIISNEKITEEFLGNGPDGEYKVKTSVESGAYIYTFVNKWEIYNKSNVLLQTIDGALPLSDYEIAEDILIKPIYETQKKTFTVTFYDGDGSTLETKTDVVYGTMLGDIYPTILPIKTSSDLTLYEAYNFLGFGQTIDSITVYEKTRPVISNLKAYAIFKKVTDIRAIIHPEYFEASLANWNGTSGYILSPALTLRGKITLPSLYNGKPVWYIQNFTNHNSTITHLFMQENNNLKKVLSNCFKNMKSLMYFDFSQNTLIDIQSDAFMNCSLINTTLSSVLETIGSDAFSNALSSTDQNAEILFTIPASVTEIGSGAFNYMNKIGRGSVLHIGSPDQLSHLDLTYPSSLNKNTSLRFATNKSPSGGFTKCNFYTSRYTSRDDIIKTMNDGTVIKVEDCFVGTNSYIYADDELNFLTE